MRAHRHRHTHTHTETHRHTDKHTQSHTHTHMYTDTCIQTHRHTCIQTHRHTHSHNHPPHFYCLIGSMDTSELADVDETGFPRRMTNRGRLDTDIRVRKHIYPTVSSKHHRKTEDGKIREGELHAFDLRHFMRRCACFPWP